MWPVMTTGEGPVELVSWVAAAVGQVLLAGTPEVAEVVVVVVVVPEVAVVEVWMTEIWVLVVELRVAEKAQGVSTSLGGSRPKVALSSMVSPS